MKAIINGKIITNYQVIENKALVFNGTIWGIDKYVSDSAEIIDAKGNYVAPGLIDIHIHGYHGSDTMDATQNALHTISRGIAKNGVIAFLPTTVTYDWAATQKALENIGENMGDVENGATILGAHLEGPFINEQYAGAQPKQHIIPPNFELIEGYKNIIKLLTLAPEVDNDFAFIKQVYTKTDIIMSMGHTGATYDIASRSYVNGVTNTTHIFNAMRGLGHRELGALGAALLMPFFCEIIADTIHINPKLYNFLLNNKLRERLILITDSIAGAGMGDGVFSLGGQPITIKDGAATLEDGTLAGSVLTLNMALKNFKEHTSISLPDLFALASANPAKSLNLRDKGSLTAGNDADIAIFDENFDCKMTIREGHVIYNGL